MPGGGRPISQDNDFGVWFSSVFFSFYGGVFLGVTFAGRSDGPAWELWAARAFIALFFFGIGWASAIEAFGELRKRGKWLPPGATEHPWLAAAGYVALFLPVSTAIVVAFVTCVELYSNWLQS